MFSFVDKDADYPTKEWVERVVILGAKPGVKYATIKSTGKFVVTRTNHA